MSIRAGVRLLVLAALVLPLPAAAQKAVIVARHAENAGDMLTEAGLARAQRLVAVLVSTGVGAVYSTDSKRTLGTATPVAEAHKVTVRIYDTADGANGFDARPFAAALRKEHPNDVVLIVAHVTTIPDILKAFGCRDDVTVAPQAFGDLFVAVPTGAGSAALVRLTY